MTSSVRGILLEKCLVANTSSEMQFQYLERSGDCFWSGTRTRTGTDTVYDIHDVNHLNCYNIDCSTGPGPGFDSCFVGASCGAHAT